MHQSTYTHRILQSLSKQLTWGRQAIFFTVAFSAWIIKDIHPFSVKTSGIPASHARICLSFKDSGKKIITATMFVGNYKWHREEPEYQKENNNE